MQVKEIILVVNSFTKRTIFIYKPLFISTLIVKDMIFMTRKLNNLII